MITLNVINDWNLVDVDNISGRLNVMWLTPEGVGISTRDYSHMTILNMICEKSNVHNFWNVEEIKKHNINDVIQLGERGKDFPENIKGSNFKLAKLMKNFMIETKFVRISGPYRDKEFGGSKYGHASKLLEHRDFVYEYFGEMTPQQEKFISKVIDKYSLEETEIQVIKYD